MGLTPSRGGSLPAPRTHLSSRFRGRDQPGAADKMAAAAFCSGPLRGSTSARPPERTWSRHNMNLIAVSSEQTLRACCSKELTTLCMVQKTGNDRAWAV
ncbi:hypothetical protein NDU88_000725 [Pleurodeles waltl]|uniref:Uncharacterized protein n=1 Tax=Pleurodeles waltl TaxID=8319 RepID=A0AAV7SY36_PLEWA|nr:hypothetical protein NDU88_000725 [Pleurodeles waltl]